MKTFQNPILGSYADPDIFYLGGVDDRFSTSYPRRLSLSEIRFKKECVQNFPVCDKPTVGISHPLVQRTEENG